MLGGGGRPRTAWAAGFGLPGGVFEGTETASPAGRRLEAVPARKAVSVQLLR